MRTLVVQATSIGDGGGRTILADFLRALLTGMPGGWRARVFVGRKVGELPASADISIETVPEAAGSWSGRLWFERKGLAQRLGHDPIDLLLSLQGSMPRANAVRRAAYIHNPLPFATWSSRALRLQPRLAAMAAAYEWSYRFTIGKRDLVIVQQEWFRNAVRERYGYDNVLVARPLLPSARTEPSRTSANTLNLFYPCAAYFYKDVETACEAVRLVSRKRPGRVTLRLTLTGNENHYARWLHGRYGADAGVRFSGPLPSARMDAAYAAADALLFPSVLESWGLPLSEARAHGLPVIAADRPHNREALAGHDRTILYPPRDAQALAQAIGSVIDRPDSFRPLPVVHPEAPFAPDWVSTINQLFAYANT